MVAWTRSPLPVSFWPLTQIKYVRPGSSLLYVTLVLVALGLLVLPLPVLAVFGFEMDDVAVGRAAGFRCAPRHRYAVLRPGSDLN